MAKRILLRISDKYIKSVAIRYLIEAGYEVVEIWDSDDLLFKLDIYSHNFILYVVEIPGENPGACYSEISRLKKDLILKKIPVLAFVPKDSSDFVVPALKSGIEDMLLLPKSKDQFRDAISGKLNTLLKRLDPPETKNECVDLTPVDQENWEGVKEKLEIDIKHAARGKYSLSLLMIHFSGVQEKIPEKFINRLKSILRETDSVFRFSQDTWLISCPFTEKASIIEVERKIFSAFEAETGKQGSQKKINLFSATYPSDEQSLQKLLERLENGINNSIVINSITSPLNSLSKAELESYKQKIRQYRKFFLFYK